jgi:prepilin-type N-terminal cleavage/methylation domain-containing protein
VSKYYSPNNSETKMTRNNRGFTLVEITVVVVLIGIIAAVLFARSISTDQINIVGEVDKIRNHIRYAQSMAMKRNEVWVISFDATQYWLSDITLNPVKLPGVETATILLADLGVSINDDDNDNDFAVYFDRLGIPYDSYVNEDDNNPITSDNPMSITISAGTESQTLNVTPETGLITTQ